MDIRFQAVSDSPLQLRLRNSSGSLILLSPQLYCSRTHLDLVPSNILSNDVQTSTKDRFV